MKSLHRTPQNRGSRGAPGVTVTTRLGLYARWEDFRRFERCWSARGRQGRSSVARRGTNGRICVSFVNLSRSRRAINVGTKIVSGDTSHTLDR